MGGKRKYPTDYHNLAKARDFEWLGPPVERTNEKTAWQCTCSYIWEATYSNMSQGKGCPSCGGSLPKIEEDYHSLAKEKGIKWIGETLPLNVKTKTEWQCSRGHEWRATRDSVHGSGQGCPDCGAEIRAKNRRSKDAQYHELAKEKGIKWLGPLPPNNHTKTWWECHKGHQWEANRMSTKQIRLCPICNNRYPKTAKDYHKLAKSKGFEWAADEIPKSVKHKTEWQCSKGHQWEATHDSLTRNGCPACGASRGEKAISNMLADLKVSFSRQYSFNQCRGVGGGILYFDFMVILQDNKQGLIEFDGEQHYRPIGYFGGEQTFRGLVKNDKLKNEFAEKYSIPLLRIPYTEFDNIKPIILDWLNAVRELPSRMGKAPKGIKKSYKIDGDWGVVTQLTLF